MNFIAYLSYNFQTFQNWKNIVFENDSKGLHLFVFLLKMLSSTFLFDKQTWICFSLNIFLSIFNVSMATAFKLNIVEKSLFCMQKSGHFNLYYKYIDYFNLLFRVSLFKVTAKNTFGLIPGPPVCPPDPIFRLFWRYSKRL